MHAEQVWDAVCTKAERVPCTAEQVRLEMPTGVFVYRNVDEALDGSDPIAKQVFTGDELETWQYHLLWQDLLPLRAMFDAVSLRDLLDDPEAAARQLTATVNRGLMELLPPLLRFLRSMDETYPLAVIRSVPGGTGPFLCRQEITAPPYVHSQHLPLSRLGAALLELLTANLSPRWTTKPSPP